MMLKKLKNVGKSNIFIPSLNRMIKRNDVITLDVENPEVQIFIRRGTLAPEDKVTIPAPTGKVDDAKPRTPSNRWKTAKKEDVPVPGKEPLVPTGPTQPLQ